MIAVYGGAFDPVTNAHLNFSAEIIHSKLADEVWITPCGHKPDDPSLKTSITHRLIMAHLAVDTTFGSKFGVRVCDEEFDQPRNVPTLLLMRRLKQKYPECDFAFVIGTDQLEAMKGWDAPACPGWWDGIEDAAATLRKECNFIVIDRPGVDACELPPNFQRIAPALKARGSTLSATFLSSREVRHRMRDDFSRYGPYLIAGPSSNRSWYDEAEGLVPASVLGHIVRYGLYSRVRARPSRHIPPAKRPLSRTAVGARRTIHLPTGNRLP